MFGLEETFGVSWMTLLVPWLVAGGAVAARLIGLVLALPFVSNPAVPAPVKVFFVFFTTVSLMWALGLPLLPVPQGALGWFLLLAPEVLLGVGMGMVVRVTLAVVDGLGQLVNQTIGLGFATMVDPASGVPSGALTRLLTTLAIVLVLALDLHLEILRALVASFELIPVGHAAEVVGSPRAMESIALLGSHFFETSLQLAAPILAVGLMIYTVLAIIIRVAPQMNLFAFGFVILIPGGLLMLGVEMPQILVVLQGELEQIPNAMLSWVRTGGFG